jgi:hypothetical protein
MFLDDDPPIAGGRELWGFPENLAAATLKVERDNLSAHWISIRPALPSARWAIPPPTNGPVLQHHRAGLMIANPRERPALE